MQKRVLIIDDDEQLNKINEKILDSSGLVSEVHICRNGKDALDYLKLRVEKKYTLPHLIILDLAMPVMNGFAFIEAFNDWDFPAKAHIELVVFTGSSNPRDKQKAMGLGIKHYIPKPYLLRPLRDIVAHMHINQADVFNNQRSFGLEKTIL